MKILSIGNSFSEDAQRYLKLIAGANGRELTCVNLYIGGCSLKKTDSADSGTSVSDEDMFTERDLDASYDESSSAKIALADGATKSDSDNVKTDGDAVEITGEGTYTVSLDFSDCGMAKGVSFSARSSSATSTRPSVRILSASVAVRLKKSVGLIMTIYALL